MPLRVIEPMTPEPLQTPRFRMEVARTARLAAPLAAGHLSHGLVGFVDTVVAGHHGTATLAAVAVGTALFWLPMMLPMGVLMSLPPAVLVAIVLFTDRDVSVGPVAVSYTHLTLPTRDLV